MNEASQSVYDNNRDNIHHCQYDSPVAVPTCSTSCPLPLARTLPDRSLTHLVHQVTVRASTFWQIEPDIEKMEISCYVKLLFMSER